MHFKNWFQVVVVYYVMTYDVGRLVGRDVGRLLGCTVGIAEGT